MGEGGERTLQGESRALAERPRIGEEGDGRSQGSQPSNGLVKVKAGLSISIYLHSSVSL